MTRKAASSYCFHSISPSVHKTVNAACSTAQHKHKNNTLDPQKFSRRKNVLEVLYHYDKFGGAWILAAARTDKNSFCLFDSGGSRKKYLGGPSPSSFGRQQRLSETTIELITSTSSRTTVSNPIVQY